MYRGLFPEEWKGYRRGIDDELYADPYFFKIALLGGKLLS